MDQESEKLKVRIVIRPSPNDDARLTVEDAMRQVLDAIEVLNAVRDRDGAPGTEGSFDWRLEKASANSPFTVEAIATPRSAHLSLIDIAADVASTKEASVQAFATATAGHPLPFSMNREGLGALGRIAARSMNGVASTLFDFVDFPAVEVTKKDAPSLLEAIRAIDPFCEMDTPKRTAFGEIDGRLIAVGTHYRAPALFLLNPLYGRVVCTIEKQMIDKLGGEATLRDVWKGQSVIVSGRLSYAPGGKLLSINIIDMRVKTPPHILLDEVIDADFTGGLEPPAYLDRLHEGDLG